MTDAEMTLDARARRAFAPVQAWVRRLGTPGAVLGMVDAAGNRAVHVAGFSSSGPDRAPMRRETWFDLASLTKVIFTTTTVLRLVEEGRLELDAPLTSALPDLRQYDVAGARERSLTFRQCLAHQTHLPAVAPLYTYGLTPATLQAFILQREWQAGPPVYSDINFMLLGLAIERMSAPLAMHRQPGGLTFTPNAAECAATELCSWRERVLQGEVHDENAFALGGAAGHAGLFGTVDGVLDFALAMLRQTLLKPETHALFRQRYGTTRTLGWEMYHTGWRGGEACAHTAIGHTGFTGTGLWIDVDRGIAWTLLTNRVHPTRHRDTGIDALRREVGAWIGAAL